MKIVAVLMLAWILFPVGGALAAAAAEPVPIEVTANSMEADQTSGRVHFKGSVVAKQAPRVIYAESLTLFFREHEKQQVIESVEAVGQVRVVEGDRVATADRMVYERKEDRMTLTGKAEVQQGKNLISGEEIVLYLTENRSLVKSGKDGRVRAVFLPQKGSQ